MKNYAHHSKKLYSIFIISMTLILSMNIFSRIYHNGAGGVYDSGDGSGDSVNIATLSCYNIIEYHIIQGAGYFLTANSDIQSLLNRVELSPIKGFDSEELIDITQNILCNMNKAKETYSLLIKIAEITPYKKEVISKLITFDYDLFRDKYNLTPDIFNKSAEYLKRGDVTGNFKKSYMEFIKIIGILQHIQSETKLNGIPDTSLLWLLNNEFQRTLLGGQYVAQIFDEILNNSLDI